MTDTKLATFRINENIWNQFTEKTKANGSNATTTLIAAVNAYLNGNSPNQPLNSNIDNSPAIVLAIATENNSILYIDRALKSDSWTPPYQLREVEHRAEWLTCSDSSLLPIIENVLVNYFRPQFNFQLPSHIYNAETTSIQSPQYTIPSHLNDRIYSLLNDSFTPEDIHCALNSLHSSPPPPQPTPQPIPEPLPQNDPISPALEKLISSFDSIGDRLNLIEEKLNTPVAPQLEEKPTAKNKPAKTLSIESEEKIPATPLRGTASIGELPEPLTTSYLANRLGITIDRLEKTRAKYRNNPEGFFRYTLEKEDGKFGWLYDPKNQWHYPCIEIPNEEIKTDQNTTINTQEIEPTPPKKRKTNQNTPLTPEELGSRMTSAKTGKPVSAIAVIRAWERCQDRENPLEAFAEYCHKNNLKKSYEYREGMFYPI